MWIVRLALNRPYTFVVMAMLILIVSPLVILRTPVDIFPNIDIPVVSIIWQYTGLDAQQIADRVVSVTERSLTTTVNNIEHVESESLPGRGIEKVFFQPGADLPSALAQVTAISQTAMHSLPAGHAAAADHHLFGVERADRADRHEQQDACRSRTSTIWR